MDEFEKRLGAFYRNIMELEEKFLDEKPDQDAFEKFQQDIGYVSNEYL